jgi:hypothetical protein
VALVYCEICGVLIKGPPGAEGPEGVICEGCFASRRVTPEGGTPALTDSDVLQFTCCYCQSLLRLRPVDRRTRVRCPQCGDTFYLHADGRIESKFQGGQTAVLQQDQVSPLLNQSLGTPAPSLANKTQPLRRPEPGTQESLLDELKPKRLEFADALPDKQVTPAAMIDTEKFRTEKSLDLLPEGVGPGQAEEAGEFIEQSDLLPDEESDGELSASDDGRLDLDAEGLRRKTGQLRPVGKGKRGTRRGKPARREREKPPPREELTPEERKARQKEREEQEKERARRLAEAERRGAEVASQGARRLLGGLALWLLWLLPLATTGLIASSSTRGAGFATRGGLGRGLERLGERVDRGVRTINGVLPPGSRLELPERAAAAPPR